MPKLQQDYRSHQSFCHIDSSILTKARDEVRSILATIEEEPAIEWATFTRKCSFMSILCDTNVDIVRDVDIEVLKDFDELCSLVISGESSDLDLLESAVINGFLNVLKVLLVVRREQQSAFQILNQIDDWTLFFNTSLNTAILAAARHNQIDCLKYLLSQKPILRSGYTDTRALTALQIAIEDNEKSVVRVLLNHGALNNESQSQSILHTALIYMNRYKDSTIYKLLISHGADINVAYGINLKTRTPLCHMICEANYSSAIMLLSMGASIDLAVGGEDGMEPLHLLIYSFQNPSHRVRHPEDIPQLFSLLLDRGADINSCDANGLSALYYFKNFPGAPGSICYDVWKRERAHWQLRAAFLTMIDGHPVCNGHIARYLFDPMITRELCSFIGVYEAPVEIIYHRNPYDSLLDGEYDYDDDDDDDDDHDYDAFNGYGGYDDDDDDDDYDDDGPPFY